MYFHLPHAIVNEANFLVKMTILCIVTFMTTGYKGKGDVGSLANRRGRIYSKYFKFNDLMCSLISKIFTL